MRPRFFDSKGKLSIMAALANWISLRDYDAAKQEATDRIVKRQSRGSIYAQNGWYMSPAELQKNSHDADDNVEYIRNALKQA